MNHGDDDNQYLEVEGSEPQERPTLVDDKAERVRLSAAQRKAKAHASEGIIFWRGVLDTEVGRREIFKFLQSAGTFSETFAVGPNGFPSPEATWFKAGEAKFGQRFLLTLFNYDPEGILKMLREFDARFKFDD